MMVPGTTSVTKVDSIKCGTEVVNVVVTAENTFDLTSFDKFGE